MSVTISLIAAVGENGVMGKSGAANHSLPWDIKSEFKYFRDTTMGKPIIWGRRTIEALGKPLPGRLNIIVTRDAGYQMEGAIVLHTLDAAIKAATEAAEDAQIDEIFIGGGAEIYKQALPSCDRLYLTEVHMKPEGDTVFPDFDRSAFEEVKREFHAKKPGESADYTITVLERRKTA